MALLYEHDETGRPALHSTLCPICSKPTLELYTKWFGSEYCVSWCEAGHVYVIDPNKGGGLIHTF